MYRLCRKIPILTALGSSATGTSAEALTGCRLLELGGFDDVSDLDTGGDLRFKEALAESCNE